MTLLLDTYDTEAAAYKLVQLAPRLRERGIAIKGVRIDSGDLAEHARQVRRILDAGGLTHVTLLGSGDLDEHRIRALLAAEAPLDGFGVGTRLDASTDAPRWTWFTSCKNTPVSPAASGPRARRLWPGRKQVYRRVAAGWNLGGRLSGDWSTILSRASRC